MECFLRSLYCQLIRIRKQEIGCLELFECDLTEFLKPVKFLQKVLIWMLCYLSDESNPIILWPLSSLGWRTRTEYLRKRRSQLKTHCRILWGKGLFKFPLDRSASSGGTPSCIYLVCLHMHAHGLAAVLMEEVIAYASLITWWCFLKHIIRPMFPCTSIFGLGDLWIVQKTLTLSSTAWSEFR